MKAERKLVWSKSRAFISLRIYDLLRIGVEIGKPYTYTMTPDGSKIIIEFKKKRRGFLGS
jgi:hypothetical protein